MKFSGNLILIVLLLWRVGRVVMQRIANPYTSVQVRDASSNIRFMGPDGGIGRHKGLKIPRPYGYAGSNPAPGSLK